MNKSFIPGPLDAANHIEDIVTTAVSRNGASLDLGVNYAPGGLGQVLTAVVQVTALDKVTGDETYNLALYESADNNTFTVCGPVVAATEVGAIAVPGFVSQRYIRTQEVLAGTTPSITHSVDLAFGPCCGC